jgi:hypothetical protein
MIDLPEQLAPWSKRLGLFPKELALGLGPWLLRLHRAFGPLAVHHDTESGDPDGYDGLSRRGRYERLLASEWLLAFEIPEEFVRRVAMGEHAFLAPAFRRPDGARRSVALFDAGPSSIGPPRLGHLAALIVLEARARAASARFSFGVVQDARRGQILEVNEASIERLLVARSSKEPSEDDRRAWVEQLGPPERDDDLWLIGAPTLFAAFGALVASRAEITEVLAPNARRVRLTVAASSGRPQKVELELPERDKAVRLLRDPFRRVVAPRPARSTTAIDPNVPIAFAADGRRLLVGVAGGGVAAVPLSNTRTDFPGRGPVFMPPAGEVLVGAGSFANRLFVITEPSGDEVLVLRELGRRGGPVRSPRRIANGGLRASPDEILPVFRVDSAGGTTDKILIHGRGSTVYEIAMAAGSEPEVRALVRGATALQQVRDRFLMVLGAARDPASGAYAGALAPVYGGSDVGAVVIPDQGGDLKAFFSSGGNRAHLGFGLIAIRDRPGRFVIHGSRSKDELSITLPPEMMPLALVEDSASPYGAAILAMPPTFDALWLCSNGTARIAFHTPEPVTQVAVSPVAPVMAYLTVAEELVVYSLERRTQLIRVLPGRR